MSRNYNYERGSNNPQNVLNKAFNDKIANILLKYSNFTPTQFECLIIDYLSDNYSDIELTYNQKTLFRSKKVSRGSFSRSLQQARNNVISSIYTILLLMYIGIYDSQPFDEYKNLSEKLSEYISIIENQNVNRSRQILLRMENELREGIAELAHSRNLKPL
jgi:hypothetical protein